MIAGDLLDLDWYRDQLRTDHDLAVEDVGNALANLRALTAGTFDTRPVLLDARAWPILGDQFRYDQLGLTVRVIPGTPRQPPTAADLTALAERLDRLTDDRLLDEPARLRWPNTEIASSYTDAVILAANAAGALHKTALQRDLLQLAIDLDPDRPALRDALRLLEVR